MRTVVHADGGCDPNPGLGGWGVVISAPEGPLDLCGGEPGTTNNRMELTAAIRALEHFPEGAQIEMRCDSQYVVNSDSKWMAGWKARGWRGSKGPVLNVDLMQRLDELASRRDVKWTWVRGHAGDPLNERADRLAAQGRREALDRAVLPTDKATLEKGFVSRKDVNGDGVPDFILDYGTFRCGDSASFFCGSAGCTTQVFASVNGGYVKVLDENVQGLTFKQVKGRPAMLLGLHGSACGRKGTQPCGTTLYWNGTKFSPAN